MKLSIDVSDVSAGLLPQIESRANNPQPALQAAADTFRQREAQLFATAGGGTWAPDDPGTARRKGSTRVLVDDGGLLRSLTVRGDRYHVERIGTDELVVGTKNPVAHLHRDGARGMPKRNPVPPATVREQEQYAEELLDFLLEGRT